MTAPPVTHLPPAPSAQRAVSAFRFGAGSVPFERSVRCLAAMGGPMLFAVLFSEPSLGAVASVGTLAAPFVGSWTFRQRVRRLSVHALCLAVTYTLGASSAGIGALNVVTLAVVATVALLVAGLAGGWATPFGVIAANVAILGAGLGATFAVGGLQGSEPSPLEGGVLVAAAGLWVMATHVVGLSPRRAEPERDAVSGSFRALAAYISALGTEHTDNARITARVSVFAAWDALGADRPDGSRGPGRTRLFVLQQDAQRLLDATVAVAFRRPTPVPAELAAAVRALGIAVVDRRLAPVIAVPEVPPRASSALSHLYSLVERTRADAASSSPEPSAAPVPLRETVRDRVEGMTAVRAVQVRTSLRVGAAVALAHTIGLVSGVDRGYWITLTTLLVMQPEPANTQVRAVQRALGTVLGVALLGPLLLLDPSSATIALGMMLVGYLLPGGFARSYLSAATLLTLYALMLTDEAAGGGVTFALLVERVLDTAIGCVIAVAAVRLIWPRAATRRLPTALAQSLRTEADLLDGQLTEGDHGAQTALADDGHPVPARERRLLLLRLLNARGLAERAAGERPQAWPATQQMWPVVILTLRIGVRLVNDPGADDTQLLLTLAGAATAAAALRDIADALESGAVPSAVPWTVADPPSPLHGDVALLAEAVAAARR